MKVIFMGTPDFSVGTLEALDKDAARRTAAAAGVPIVPGCDLLKSQPHGF